jgi:MscS family membrane protein
VFLEILRLARSLGVAFAFPTQTLNVDYVHPPGRERSLPSVPDERALAENVVAFGPKGKHSRPHGPTIVEGGFSARSAEGADEDG